MPFCTKCGAEFNVGDKFCFSCGVNLHESLKEPLTEQVEQGEDSERTHNEPDKNVVEDRPTSNTNLIVFIVVLAIIFIIVTLVVLFGNNNL